MHGLHLPQILKTKNNIMDIAKRSLKNPLLRPADLKAGINGMEISNRMGS